MPRILVVEDEGKVLRNLRDGLQEAGFQVETAATGAQGARLAATQSFECIVLDWMLPGRDGLQVLTDLRRSGQSTPVLLLTARDTIEDRVADFVEHYNHVRLHSALGYITPVDRMNDLGKVIWDERDRKLEEAGERLRLARRTPPEVA
jgi:CheY-like chemotaxis protein